MNIKMNQLLNSSEALKTLVSLKVPAKTSYNISRIVSIVEKELEAFNAARTKCLDTLGTKEEDKYTFTPETAKEFDTQMKELLEQEVVIDRHTIKLDDLNNVEVEASVLLTLDWLIEE